MSIAGLQELGPLTFKDGRGISPQANIAGDTFPAKVDGGKVQAWAAKRQPLRQILLVVRPEKAQDLALNWTMNLARRNGASLTVLVLLPLVPLLSSREARLQQGLAMLLAEDSLLEQQLRHISQRLADKGLEASLRLRQGSPEQQLRAELDAQKYDLVVVTEAKAGGYAAWSVTPLNRP